MMYYIICYIIFDILYIIIYDYIIYNNITLRILRISTFFGIKKNLPLIGLNFVMIIIIYDYYYICFYYI
jgi:hypothetical protein